MYRGKMDRRKSESSQRMKSVVVVVVEESESSSKRGKRKSVAESRRGGKMKSVVEESESSKTLFVEMKGYLMGIDLNHYDDMLQSSPAAAAVPICYHINLAKNGYPICMRHVRINGDIYLLGGASPNDPQYSDKIYRFHPSRLTRGYVNPSHVLEAVTNTTLAGAKVPIVANLKGDTYLLHHWIPDTSPCFKVQAPFERLSFDASTNTLSSHQQPSPPFYHQIDWPTYLDWPMPYPVSAHFVVDDKLVLLSRFHTSVLTFTPRNGGTGEWTSSSDYYLVCRSFSRRGGGAPLGDLWLSNFRFPHDDSLAVLLSIHISDISTGYRSDIPQEYVDIGRAVDFCIDYKVCAYAISKTSFRVKFYQPLDEVFSGILPDPISDPLDSSTITHHFLDLGESHHGEGIRRICALLTALGLTDGVPYLFVSIFDLQMTRQEIDPPKRPSHPSHFLSVVTSIKKLAFRLDKQHCSYDDEVCSEAFCNPILDAFIL